MFPPQTVSVQYDHSIYLQVWPHMELDTEKRRNAAWYNENDPLVIYLFLTAKWYSCQLSFAQSFWFNLGKPWQVGSRHRFVFLNMIIRAYRFIPYLQYIKLRSLQIKLILSHRGNFHHGLLHDVFLFGSVRSPVLRVGHPLDWTVNWSIYVFWKSIK